MDEIDYREKIAEPLLTVLSYKKDGPCNTVGEVNPMHIWLEQGYYNVKHCLNIFCAVKCLHLLDGALLLYVRLTFYGFLLGI